MSHCENSRKVNAYHDGELREDERVAFERHLRDCPLCSAELERLRHLSRLLATASLAEIPSEMLDRLHSGFSSVGEIAVVRIARELMVAAAAVFIICAGLLWHAEGMQESNSATVAAWERVALTHQIEQPLTAFPDDPLGQWVVEALLREKTYVTK